MFQRYYLVPSPWAPTTGGCNNNSFTSSISAKSKGILPQIWWMFFQPKNGTKKGKKQMMAGDRKDKKLRSSENAVRRLSFIKQLMVSNEQKCHNLKASTIHSQICSMSQGENETFESPQAPRPLWSLISIRAPLQRRSLIPSR